MGRAPSWAGLSATAPCTRTRYSAISRRPAAAAQCIAVIPFSESWASGDTRPSSSIWIADSRLPSMMKPKNVWRLRGAGVKESARRRRIVWGCKAAPPGTRAWFVFAAWGVRVLVEFAFTFPFSFASANEKEESLGLPRPKDS
jgi:hypothetical protein